ncbi:hypothetical protein Ancab_001426 [Ancistrocladus abbreviatus]
MNELSDEESIRARWEIDAKSWWLLYGVYTPKLRDHVVRLLGQVRRSASCMEGDDKLWDITGDLFDPMDDVRLLKFANLSLDEPKLVNDICDDGNDIVVGSDPIDDV